MNKRVAISVAIVVGLIAISTPIAIAIYWAWKQSLNEQLANVRSLASDVMRRSDESVDQTFVIFNALQAAGAKDPCSVENIRLMGKLDLASEQVQAVGYLENDRLLCSSYGRLNTPVGRPAYTTPYGTEIRNAVEFPVLPGVRFILSTHVKSGYSVAIHPKQPLDVFADDPRVSVGVYSSGGNRLIISRGPVKAEWITALGQANDVQFSDGQHVVALRRSPKYALVAVAAIPLQPGMGEALRRSAAILVPIGLIAGIVLALAVLHLARQQLAMPAVLKVALKRNEFFLLYQPLVELRGGRCVGAEALIRWRRPSGEMVRPDVFIPVAEDSGLIRDVTKRVLEIVGKETATFLKQRPGFHIGVNLSSLDLQALDTPRVIQEIMASAGIRPSNLLVEATERGFMQADVARRVLNDIRSLNIRVAIDDFGTGYSSLSYLEKFKLDYLKIDKSFVDTMGGEAATSQVAIAIIEMAKSLKLEMIAEGVETEAQLKFLQERGVQFAQGYYFGKPMPLRELAAYVHSSEKLAA